MVEEIPRLLVDGDVELGGKGTDQRPGQPGVGRVAAVGLPRPHQQRVVGIGAQAVECQDVDDAFLARDQRIHPEQGFGGVAELLQAVVEGEVEIGEGLEVVPKHRPQPGAVVARQAGGKVDRFAPVVGTQFRRDAGEERVEILDDVEHVVGIEVAHRRRLCLGAQLGQALADRRSIGPLELRLLVVEVEQEGVAQNLHDVGLRQQPHPHREVWHAVAEAETEPGDQAGRLAIARRIDLAQEVVGFVGETGLQGPAVAAGQDRDQVGLAGLAGTEDADAHAPAGGARQFAALVAHLLKFADQRRCLLGHGRRLAGGGLEPVHAFAGGDGHRFAVLGQLEIDGVHFPNRSSTCPCRANSPHGAVTSAGGA